MSEREPPPAGSRWRAGIEVAALVSGVLAIMWIVPLTAWPRYVSNAIVFLLVLLLLACHVRDRVGPRTLGLRWDNLLPVLWRLTPPVIGFVIVVVAMGLILGTLRLGPRFYLMVAAIPPWALLQQYLLLGFVHRRLRVVIGPGRRSVFATAILFGLLHLPNPVFVVVCALGGFIWAREYDRSPNLFAHSITHAVGSAFLSNSLPDSILKHMVVGYRYFTL